MIDWIKDQYSRADKKHLLAIGTGTLAVAALIGYFSVQNSKTRKIPTPEPTTKAKPGSEDQREEFHGAVQSEQMAFIKIINSLKRLMPEHEGGKISYQVVKAIFKGQYILSRGQFKTLTINNRLQRRQKLDDINQYYKIVSKYESELEGIHNKHLNSLLTHFHISQAQWIELTDEAGVQFNQDWDNFIIENDQEQIESLRNQQKPKLKLAAQINIATFKRKLLKDKIEDFKTILSKVQAADLYSVVEKWVRDKVHQAFMVEEQDINYSYKQLTEEQKDKLEPYEAEIRSLMESLILESDDEVESHH